MYSGTINIERGNIYIYHHEYYLGYPPNNCILSSFTHLQIVPNLCKFFLILKKEDILKSKLAFFPNTRPKMILYYILLCYVKIVNVILVIMVLLPCMCC